jgi:hypothetical protein
MNRRAKHDERDPPVWVLVASVVVLVATLLFFMALVLLAVSGREIPPNSRFLVIIVVAFGAGFGSAGLGGYVAARGKVPLPAWADNHPVAVSAGGGIAVFLIVFFLGTQILPTVTGNVDLRLRELNGSVAGSNPQRILVEATFQPMSLRPTEELVLRLAIDDACEDTQVQERVDDPRLGTMSIFLRRNEREIRCGRLSVEEPSANRTELGPTRQVSR